MDLYTIYDYPRLPRQVEQDSLRVAQSSKPFFEIALPGQCVFELYQAPLSLQQWFLSNSFFDHSCAVFVQQMRFGNCMLPHVDAGDLSKNVLPRECAFNYLLSPSGPATEWYRDQDISTVFERVVFPSHTWHRIKTDVLHGVRNITEPRIAITISKYEHETPADN